jgi:hypothetical protein
MNARWRCLACAAALLLAGCQQISLRKTFPWVVGEDGQLDRPLKVVAFWTDTVLTQPGQVPIRGFGGRLMFYKDHEAKPLKVSGSLTVYAFDESQGGDHVNPDRKYMFTPEQFAEHYSKGKLGHSYSVWLPWDEVGGERKRITLIVRFEPTQGGIVVSEPSQHILPGMEPALSDAGRQRRQRRGGAASAALSQRDATPAPASPTLDGSQEPSGTDRAEEHHSPPDSAVAVGQIELDAAEQVQPVAYHSDPDDPPPPRRLRPVTIPLPSHYSHSALRPARSSQTHAARASSLGRATQQEADLRLPAQADPHRQDSPRAEDSGARAARPTHRSDAPQARFGPQRSRPLGAPIARLERDRARWPPRHATPQSDRQPEHPGQTSGRQTP